MKINHHPGDSWLMDYALGNLDNRFDTVLRTHLAVCSSCRESVSVAEQFGGELLATLMPEAPSANAAASARTICDNHEQQSTDDCEISRAADIAVGDDIEQFVKTFLDSSLDALPWRGIGKGLKLCRLGTTEDVRLWMLRGSPGTVLPEHTHTGGELTLVLKGSYFCGNRIYGPGDIEDADESTEHQPVITRDGECICLAATEGPLRFRAWLPRTLQPLIGI